MEKAETVFDRVGYNEISEARSKWLIKILDELPFCDSLETALDVACGAGHFSQILARRGLDTTGSSFSGFSLETPVTGDADLQSTPQQPRPSLTNSAIIGAYFRHRYSR